MTGSDRVSMGPQVTAPTTFESYVVAVENLAAGKLGTSDTKMPAISPSDCLDGRASLILRQTVPLQERRKLGAFFSGSELRRIALPREAPDLMEPESVLDPAVGAGDLLLEAAWNLPAHSDPLVTLQRWGPLLHGRDKEPDFVRLAKARLVLLAVSRGSLEPRCLNAHLDEVFPEIRVGDGLDLLGNGWTGNHIVMNPPYTFSAAAPDTDWSSGKTSLAATFLATAVEKAHSDTRLTAILPDVIRTGSRYQQLRSHVEEHLRISEVTVYGQFDAWTDVDVFILRGVVNRCSPNATAYPWWKQATGETLGDRCEVRVGPVVPHRHQETGPQQPFLHAQEVPLGGTFSVDDAETRGFQQTSFSPPFVVVRRTTRPGDSARGAGTLICGTTATQVENHLIVVKPKDGSVASCRRVVDMLALESSKQWLDDRIRCRHLTVRALKEMPWGRA